MKAVVTAAGLGTRSGLDGKFRKEMLPLYDMREGKLVLRPVIDIVLTRIREAGADEVYIKADRVDELAVRLSNIENVPLITTDLDENQVARIMSSIK